MKVLIGLLSTCSIAVSALFCWLSVAYLGTADGELVAILAGVAAGLYGIGSAAILVAAWLKPAQWVASASRWSAGAVALLWLLGSLVSGRVSGLEFLSLLGLVVLLAINVFSVGRVLAAAQQVNPVGSPAATD